MCLCICVCVYVCVCVCVGGVNLGDKWVCHVGGMCVGGLCVRMGGLPDVLISEQNRRRGIDADKGRWHNIYLPTRAAAVTTQTRIH